MKKLHFGCSVICLSNDESNNGGPAIEGVVTASLAIENLIVMLVEVTFIMISIADCADYILPELIIELSHILVCPVFDLESL